MTVTDIRASRQDRQHDRAQRFTKPDRVAAPPPQRRQLSLERLAAVEAEIRENLAQAEAWPEHAEHFLAEAERLRAELDGTSVRRAA
jgi:hypothetical protein